MSAVIFACCWCKRRIVNGVCVGEPLVGAEYAEASHGFGEACAADWAAKQGFVDSQVVHGKPYMLDTENSFSYARATATEERK